SQFENALNRSQDARRIELTRAPASVTLRRRSSATTPQPRHVGQALPCRCLARLPGRWGAAMIGLDSLQLLAFLAVAFAASLTAGLVGFAFALIAAGPWLHLLAPA